MKCVLKTKSSRIQVHPGLRHQHLPPAAAGPELHRSQHELQRLRLPAGSLQEGFFLYCDVLSPLWSLRHRQLDFISNQSWGIKCLLTNQEELYSSHETCQEIKWKLWVKFPVNQRTWFKKRELKGGLKVKKPKFS